MRKNSWRTTSLTEPTGPTVGDVEAALSLADQLRLRGFVPTYVSVGSVEFELEPMRVAPSAGPHMVATPGRTLVEEYGGPEMAKLLEQEDLVDDEDQPAVRSSS